MDNKRQYILLPRRDAVGHVATNTILKRMAGVSSTTTPLLAALGASTISVLDSVHDIGPKLVVMDENTAERTNASDLPIRAIPVVFYDRPDPQVLPLSSEESDSASTGPAPIIFECIDNVSGAPVPNAKIVAFTDFAKRIGAQGLSNQQGTADLEIHGDKLERVYVYPPPGYWGAYSQALDIGSRITLQLTAIDLNFADAVRAVYGNSRFDASLGIKVGVLDSGIGPHHDLNVVGGANTVTGESRADYHDGGSHGTHVAGLIGANRVPPHGLRGVAPNVELMGYRVFGTGAAGASNYAIMKAMIFAAENKCDIINLSLGGGPYDIIVEEAIRDAKEQGMLVVIAAGNDGRQPVNYPAAYPDAVAVSALGVEGSFPKGSLEYSDIERPPLSAQFPNEFIAAFSNVGPQISVVGPGVGVLSTLPNDQYGPKSGTSMAAPVIAGAAACLLSQDRSMYSMQRNRTRADTMRQTLQSNCIKRGFGAQYEGYGLPDPSVV